jgi:hypothetical protein
MARWSKAKGPSTGLSSGGGLSTPLIPELRPAWMPVLTFTHTQLQAAALTNDIAAYSLPAGAVYHGHIFKTTIAFAGTGILTYTLSLGIGGELERFCEPFNVMTAVLDGNLLNAGPAMEAFSMGVATSLRLSAVSTGANLDQSTAGSVRLYLLLSLLP